MVANVEQQLESLSGYLRGFALKLTRNSDQANDLYQDTILRILMYKDRFQLGTNFRAWASTVMKNIFINAYRRKRLANTIFDNTENNYLLESASHIVANSGEHNLALTEIMDVVDSVREEFRTPFLMSYYGFKYEEIADTLQIPLGTVKSRIFLARQEMMNKIDTRKNYRDLSE